VNSDVSSADTRTEVLSREKKGRTPLADEVNVTGLLRGAATKQVRRNKISLREAPGVCGERGD
jgi:hypothetical protein